MKTIQQILPAWMSSEGEYQDVVLFTRLSLNRNVENFPFPHFLDQVYLPELLALGEQAAATLYPNVSSFDLGGDSTGILTEQFYVDRNMLGMGRRINISENKNSALLVNGEDHLSIMEFAAGFSPGKQLDILEHYDAVLEDIFQYAVSVDMGYLLSRIDRAGSGLHIDICLHLPALSECEHFSGIVARARRNGLDIMSFGDSERPIAHLFLLSTNAALGNSEEEILELIDTIIQEFVHLEREQREKFRKITQTIDQIWRDFAILRNCRLLSLRESLNRFSNVRIGSSLGILPLPPLSLPFFASQSAHLRAISSLPAFKNYVNHNSTAPNSTAPDAKNAAKNDAESTDYNELRAAVFRTLLEGFA
ncbi:MAG: hypothetical protein ACR2PY_06955 [Salinispira sp.]